MSDATKIEQEIAALGRISQRLQSTFDENLPAVLTSLLPKLIPLSNQDPLRGKVVEIITEALRRAKASKCPLPLSIFSNLVQSAFLPFACNFAFAFLDALSDIHCIVEVNEQSVAPLLTAIESFPLFSFQSNATLYYVLLFAAHVDSAAKSVESGERRYKITSTIGEYFLDVSLLQSLPVDGNACMPVCAGLSDKRMARLLLKKKQLRIQSLKDIKLNLLDVVSNADVFADSHYGVLISISALNDPDRDVATKALQSINRLKDRASHQRILWINEFLALPFGISLVPPQQRDAAVQLTRNDRTPWKRETVSAVLDFVLQNISRFPSEIAPNSFLLAEILQSLLGTSDERAVVRCLDLLCAGIDHWPALRDETDWLLRIVSSLEKTVESFIVSTAATQMSVEQQAAAVRLRTSTFSLLRRIFAVNSHLVEKQTPLLIALFTVAEKDDLSAGTALFAILHDVQDCVQIEANDPTFQSIYSLLTKFKSSPKPSCRLLYLQWLHKCVGWNCEVLLSLAHSSEDPVDIVSNHARRLLRELSDHLTSSKDAAIDVFPALVQALRALNLRSLSRCSVGMTSLISCASICCGSLAPSLALTKPDTLTHAAVFELQQQSTLSPLSLSMQHVEELLLGVLRVLSLCEETNVSAQNIFLLTDERWSCVDALREDTESEFHITSDVSLLLDCCKLITALTRCVTTCSSLTHQTNPSNETDAETTMARIQDQLLEVLRQRREKCVRTSVGQALALLSLSVSVQQRDDLIEVLSLIVRDTSLSTPAADAVSDREELHLRAATALQTLSLLCAVTRDDAIQHRVVDTSASLLAPIASRMDDPRALSASETVVISDWCETVGILSLCAQKACQELSLRDQCLSLVIRSLSTMHAVKSVFLSQALILCSARCVYVSNDSSRESVLKLFLNPKGGWLTQRGAAFSAGEALVALTLRDTERREDALLSLCSKLFSHLEREIEQIAEPSHTAKKCFFCVQALVAMQYLQNNKISIVLPFSLLERALHCALACLRENDGFLQDISALLLGRLYDLSSSVERESSLARFLSVRDWLAHEIAVTVTRKKRPLATSSTRTESSTDRADNNATTTTATLPAELAGVLAGAEEADEVLEAAAAIAAAELSSTLQGRQDSTSANAARTDVAENNYGAYSKVCSIARKSGDSAIVMQALQLVQCDPSFGTTDTLLLRCQYRHASIRIEDERVPALLPSLFLAKFDPVASVRDIMQRVWQRVVASEVRELSLLQTHHAAVLAHLIANMLNPHWREREAACLAIEALLRNQPWNAMRREMAELLQKGLKLLDDLRESTRKVATSLTKTLMQNVLRAANPAESPVEDCRETIAMALPILLDKGLVSPSMEARGFSLGTLIKIVDTSQQLLQPYLERLIDALIESVSALEPQMLNYLQFHTASMQVGSEEWERARVELSKSSPMHEALRRCLSLVSIDQLPAIANVSFAHLQRGVGLATKVAAADALSFLAEKYPIPLGAVAGKSLRAISFILVDRPHLEATLRKAMLNTLGMLAKVVHSEILEDECNALLTCTNDSSLCLQTIVQRAGERITDSSLWTRILAISYLGEFDESAELSSAWKDTLTTALDLTGCGTRSAALHRIMPQLTVFVPRLLLHSSWEKRRQATRVIKDMLLSATQYEVQHCFAFILCALLLCIPGSMWTGQHYVLDCLFDILSKHSVCFVFDETSVSADDVAVLSVENVATIALQEKIDLSLSLLTLRNPAQDVLELKRRQESLDVFLSCVKAPEKSEQLPKWTVDVGGLLRLMLKEVQRGEDEYRISASAVISRLPWRAMVTERNGLSTLTFLLCSLGKNFDMFPLSRAVSDTPSQPTSHSLSSSSAIKAVSITTKTAKASFMFGNRYGELPKGPRRASGLNTTAKKVTTTSSPAALSFAADTVMEVGGDSTAEDTPSAEEEESSSGSPIPSYSSSVTGGAHAQETSPSSLPSKQQQVAALPAVRMHLLESLARVISLCEWESTSADENTVFVRESLSGMLQDIKSCFLSEAWSIKKAMIQVITSLGSKRSSGEESLASVVRVLILGAEETKFVKVRIAALEGLEALLKSPNKEALKSEHIEKIRRVARVASVDTRQSVLETVSRLQEQLLNL